MDKTEIKNFYRGKKVFVTGHTGFKGGWLTKILLKFEAIVSGYSLAPHTKPNIFNALRLENQINHYLGDIFDFEKLKKALEKEKPEIVFHLAAQPIVRDSYDDPLYTYRTNIVGTANLLQVVKEIGGVRSVVVITTDKVYENKEGIWPHRECDVLGGHDPYSASKACAELIVASYAKSFFSLEGYGQKHHTLICSARAGNVIGGGDWAKDRIFSDLVRAVFEKNERLKIRSPSSIRPWQHVLEPLYGYLLLGKALFEGKKSCATPFNFAPDDDNLIPVEKLVKNALSIAKRGEYYTEEDSSKHETGILKLDATKAKTILDWSPLLNMEETLVWTLDWYTKFYGEENIHELTERQIEDFFSRIKSTGGITKITKNKE